MWIFGGCYPMRVLRSRFNSSPEWHQALQLLARSPRGAIEDVLELGHGFSREMLATIVLAGLATVVTETLGVEGGTFKVERMRITDAGRKAINGLGAKALGIAGRSGRLPRQYETAINRSIKRQQLLFE
jgi:hypothetical protein